MGFARERPSQVRAACLASLRDKWLRFMRVIVSIDSVSRFGDPVIRCEDTPLP